MYRLLDAARSGAPWSLCALVFGLDDVLDAEGRPLHERRAPSLTKHGVPMELVACPYHDERRGRPMNASALEQLLRHFPAAAARVAGFRGMLGPLPRWEAMLRALLDLLAAPSLALLFQADSRAPLPAPIAAGYKLAAGYYSALLAVLEHEARAAPLEPTASSFLAFVREHRLLLGPSEACAGPTEHLTALTRILLDATPPPAPVEARRAGVAELLAAQARIALSWRLVDEAAEAALLDGAVELLPKNHVMADRLGDRRAELARRPPLVPARAAGPLLAAASATETNALAGAVDRWASGAAQPSESTAALVALLELGEGGYAIGGDRRLAAARLAALVALYRSFAGAQCRLERALRAHLSLPVEAGVELGAPLLPKGRGLAWLEALTGHHLVRPSELEVALHSHKRTIRLA